MKPQFITFTGVDEHTDPAGLIALSDIYPIEWGLLFSPKRQGSGRYPPMHTIEWLVSELPLVWSAHLCGGDARSVIETGKSPHDHLLRNGFMRSQINTSDPSVQPSLIRQWADSVGVRGILQCRGDFPRLQSVDVLYDPSGGRGTPSCWWPVGIHGQLCGYAGGIGPGNAAKVVKDISDRCERYWIDMESGVRDDQDRFDLAKVRAVCEAVYEKPALASGCGDGVSTNDRET